MALLLHQPVLDDTAFARDTECVIIAHSIERQHRGRLRPDPSMGVHIEEVRSRLAKRNTFEAAVTDLASLLTSDRAISGAPAFQDAVQRSFTLLKSRYTAPAFWAAGRRLYLAAKEKAPDEVLRDKYNRFIGECSEHLGEDSTSSVAHGAVSDGQLIEQRAPPAYLFEGQLSQGAEPPARQRGLHDLLTAMAAQAAGNPPDEDSAAGARGSPAAAPAQPALISFEALEQELAEALAQSMAEADALEGARPGGPPPASKHVVRTLPRERLTEERLKELGGREAQCSVCREGLAVGEEVQVMPCSDAHVFHPSCLAPWLREHNSCPVCRHELPTDDDRYERQKERDAADKEARKGADNAVSHNEFVFL